MFMSVTVLLRLQMTNWSLLFGSMCMELMVTSPCDPDRLGLKVLAHSVVFRFHNYIVDRQREQHRNSDVDVILYY